jgi:hypothetical protein
VIRFTLILCLSFMALSGCAKDTYVQPKIRAEVVMPPEYVGWWQALSNRSGPWNMHISQDGIIGTYAAPTWQSVPNKKKDSPGVRHEFFPLKRKHNDLYGISRTTTYDSIIKKWSSSYYNIIILRYDPNNSDSGRYLKLDAYDCNINNEKADGLRLNVLIDLVAKECDSEKDKPSFYSSWPYSFLMD